VAEGGGLLNRYTVKSRIGGSNPPLSAIFISIQFYRIKTTLSSFVFRQTMCKICVSGSNRTLSRTAIQSPVRQSRANVAIFLKGRKH
jgi:hypothetical protein